MGMKYDCSCSLLFQRHKIIKNEIFVLYSLETLLFSHSAPLSYKRLDLSPRIHNCRYHDPGLVLITHVLDIIRLDVLIRRVHLIIPRSL